MELCHLRCINVLPFVSIVQSSVLDDSFSNPLSHPIPMLTRDLRAKTSYLTYHASVRQQSSLAPRGFNGRTTLSHVRLEVQSMHATVFVGDRQLTSSRVLRAFRALPMRLFKDSVPAICKAHLIAFDIFDGLWDV